MSVAISQAQKQRYRITLDLERLWMTLTRIRFHGRIYLNLKDQRGLLTVT